MKHLTKVTAGGLAIVAGSLAFNTAVDAKTFVLRMGSGHPSKPVAYVRNMEHHMADYITKRVAAETKHKVRIIHAYAGKIAKVHETLEAVEKGLLDLGGYCVCFESAKLLPLNWDYFTPFTTGDIRKQTRKSLQNVRDALKAAGSSMDQVVKVNVYCSNSGYFDTINEEYRKFFPKDPPARTFVTVGSWPWEFDIEVECTAICDD